MFKGHSRPLWMFESYHPHERQYHQPLKLSQNRGILSNTLPEKSVRYHTPTKTILLILNFKPIFFKFVANFSQQFEISLIKISSFIFKYQINLTGDHSVEVKYTDVPIHGSPFIVKAYDSNKVRVADVNNGVVGKFVYFSSKFHFHLHQFTSIET